ncbi:hypothetical protein F5B22DRAFT_590406 [Xylaria bambusicola]|uniref:uncharacterized protein n=1 Tax=Xylaria bambusicola TaxID=326684 RepID=UPI0020078C5B|nr:uncharacterized protein F5B22DRAFT_590406 [Xylaria bambusicola]KAI0525536.1 hypothetical protein F5B22DRAFT_590406 [Xylaria bambusicola]
MESLRGQLAETQSALTERDKKFRQLRAEQKVWLEEKSSLEAKIARLESENMRLLRTPPTPDDKPKHRISLDAQQDMEEGENVTLKRSQVKQAEKQFQQMAGELAEKTKQCDVLTAKLAQANPTSTLELSNAEAVTRWNQLRAQIRSLSRDHLGKGFAQSLPLPSKSKDEFKMLSPHWKSYTSTPNVTSYFLRALIWRYLLRYFEVPCRAFGRDISMKMSAVAAGLWKKIPDVEYHDWRIRTAALIHKAHSIDKSLIDEIVVKVQEAISPLVADTTSSILKVSIRSIVETTAKLSAAFDVSNFVVLMTNEPGGTLIHGFPYVEKLMDMKVKLGAQEMVDLMVTPSLLKRDADYSVLVKAEVVC